jgi:predicted nucleic acid-binding protein
MDSLPKIIAIDANVLVCLCEKSGDRKEKIDHLIAQLDKSKGKVVIPTPSIAEFLVHADQAGLGILEALQKRSSVFIASFDLAAAYENSQMDAAALGRKDKRDGSKEAWQKIKVDRQIVAIAKTQGAKFIVSDDDGVRASAARTGIKAKKIDELPLPDSAIQTKLPMEDPEQPSE